MGAQPSSRREAQKAVSSVTPSGTQQLRNSQKWKKCLHLLASKTHRLSRRMEDYFCAAGANATFGMLCWNYQRELSWKVISEKRHHHRHHQLKRHHSTMYNAPTQWPPTVIKLELQSCAAVRKGDWPFRGTPEGLVSPPGPRQAARHLEKGCEMRGHSSVPCHCPSLSLLEPTGLHGVYSELPGSGLCMWRLDSPSEFRVTGHLLWPSPWLR